MDESSTVLDFPKLSGAQNFHEWKLDVEMLLRDRGLYGFVSGTEVELGADAKPKEINEFNRRKDRAISTIYRALEPSIKRLIANEKEPAKAWKILQENFEPSSKALIGRLFTEFFSAKMKPEESIAIYLARLQDLVRQLDNVKCKLDDKHLAYKMISNLPDRYNLIVQQLYQLKDEEFTSERVSQALLAEDGRLQNTDRPNENVYGAFSSSVKNSKNYVSTCHTQNADTSQVIRCFSCNQIGHIQRFCPLNNKKGNNFSGNRGTSQHPRGRRKYQDQGKTNFKSNFSSAWCMQISNEILSDKKTFIFDSGATNHFCHDRSLFVTFDEIKKNVKQGKGYLSAKGKGDIQIELKGENGNVKVKLVDAYYIPEISNNLISLGMIEKAGWSFVGKNNYLSIYDPNGKLFLKTANRNSIYPIEGIKTEPEVNNIQIITTKSLRLWHERCVHINPGVIYKMAKMKTVLGIDNLKNEDINCHECIQGKLKRGPFKRLKEIKSKQPLQLLHVDLWGPAPAPSLGGNKYFLGIVDDYSRWLTVFPLKNKNDAARNIKEFITRSERQLNYKVKCVRSDNGLEFCCQELSSFFIKLGIKHERSNVASPEMNGVAEKIMGDSMNAVRTLLLSSKMKSNFWAEALQCYTHVRNRLPHSTDKMTTPYEKWYNRKPNIFYFRVFGSLCFYHLPKIYRNKLDPVALKGIFVGYATHTKGYRIYDPLNRKIVELKYVKFDESITGIDGVKRDFIHRTAPNSDFGETLDSSADSPDSEDPPREKISPSPREIETTAMTNDFQHTSEPAPTQTPEKRVTESPPTLIKKEESDPPPRVNDSPVKDISKEWKRVEIKRKTGHRTDVYYYSPNGIKCRSINDIKREAEKQNIDVNLTNFNFKPTVNEIKIKDDESDNSDTEPILMALNIQIPGNFKEAILSPNRENWEKAIKEELDTISQRDVWDIVSREENMKVITNRWVFSLKTDQEGIIKKFKARLVAHGHKQKYMEDYDLTFSPVIDFELIKMFYVLLVILNGWKDRHFDVKCAYLYGNLTDEIFMEIPEGYTDNDVHKNKVLKLKKALYGLKQSGRNWYEHLTETLKTLNFIQSQFNPCVFYFAEKCVILIYVDDFVIFTKDDETLRNVFSSLSAHYEITNLGEISNILGVQFEKCDKKIYIHQMKYIEKLLQKFNVDLTVNVYTPLDCNYNYNMFSETSHECMEIYPFRELLGSLLFLANRTRPDILFSVIYVAQFSSNPSPTHYKLLLRILKYIGCTKSYAIEVTKANSNDLKIYSDASWASSVDCRRSISGYIWCMGGVYLGWRSTTQKCIAKSTMEAEFVALDMAVTEIHYLANVINECNEFNNFCKIIPTVLCDNQAAIAFSRNVIVNNRTKHIDVRYFYIRELLNNNLLIIIYVPSKFNVADMLTKSLLKPNLLKFVNCVFTCFANGGHM